MRKKKKQVTDEQEPFNWDLEPLPWGELISWPTKEDLEPLPWPDIMNQEELEEMRLKIAKLRAEELIKTAPNHKQ